MFSNRWGSTRCQWGDYSEWLHKCTIFWALLVEWERWPLWKIRCSFVGICTQILPGSTKIPGEGMWCWLGNTVPWQPLSSPVLVYELTVESFFGGEKKDCEVMIQNNVKEPLLLHKTFVLNLECVWLVWQRAWQHRMRFFPNQLVSLSCG